jgi:hypothetical protein
VRAEDWLFEPRDHMNVATTRTSGLLANPATTAPIKKFDDTYGDFRTIEVTHRAGHPTSASKAAGAFDVGGDGRFASVVVGSGAVTSHLDRGSHVRWVVAEPVRDRAGRMQRAVVGDLDPARLPQRFDAELSHGEGVAVVDTDHRRAHRVRFGVPWGLAENLEKNAAHATTG